ncbi:bifunctional 4-hydroxy-2-oxoglutarate aldolase/2-dehydro-3-deoxy-phosphogluconate aldolase [Flagellimonas iocasae]|uniref:Bifunctional 4-hydroxy-2-oxoglutarate aldolase/2-dehydro-3-deoxy-phosphogluconate aldolase n=1 Tax=Flagellimonas iocasae TaxID=2055905 RepID=A0ABW4Y169_9FLAO
MTRQEIVTKIKQGKLMAIVRLKEQSKVSVFVDKLVAAKVKVLEITSNTPGYLEEITNARRRYADNSILIGAGTVTDVEIAKKSIASGAQFLVTPNTNPEVVTIAHQNEIPVVMGALTPTEICTAANHNADIIKLFPAGAMGLDYFKSIKGPLNNIDFFVVGGIDLSNVEEWMSAGASGVGLGSVLTNCIESDGSSESLERTVRAFFEKVNK